MTWKAWEDDENTETDSFTVTNAVEESRGQGSDPVMFSYNCPEGSYGGQARATIPKSWDIGDAEYFTFWAKGDGSKQRFILRFEQEKVQIKMNSVQISRNVSLKDFVSHSMSTARNGNSINLG